MVLQAIFKDCGLAVERYHVVHGGDINDAYCLYTSNSRFFLKVNDALKYPGMFAHEAAGLSAIQSCSTLTVPEVIGTGTTDGKQYLLMQWMERGEPKPIAWQQFGAALAAMHRKEQPWFGWEADNYIGSLPQTNSRHETWAAFFAECRVLPLAIRLFDTGSFSKRDLIVTESFCRETANLFPNEPPSLLHGDLWSGNYMATSQGMAVFDPSVYYGHREMDIGMTLLFGGFDKQFYNAYNETYRLATGWQERIPLAQLYPLLVHAVLFGGHYLSSARDIIMRFGA